MFPAIYMCWNKILFSKSYEFGETIGLDILKGSVIKIPYNFKNKKINVRLLDE